MVDLDDSDNCRQYVTKMNFQDDTFLIPIDSFEGHFVLVFDMNSMQGAAEKCQYSELNK